MVPSEPETLADRSQAATGDAGRSAFLWVRRLTAVGTPFTRRVLKGRWVRFSSLGAHLPLAPGPPPPASRSITLQSILHSAQLGASCVAQKLMHFQRNARKLGEAGIPSEFAGVLLPDGTRAASSTPALAQKNLQLAGKRVSPQSSIWRPVAPPLVSGISVKFLKLPWKPAPSWEADIPGGYWIRNRYKVSL